MGLQLQQAAAGLVHSRAGDHTVGAVIAIIKMVFAGDQKIHIPIQSAKDREISKIGRDIRRDTVI